MSFHLIEFSVNNFRIFKDKAVFSMSAHKSQHTFSVRGENLLKTSLIYGPNASGKSTLLKAVLTMINTIFYSTELEKRVPLPYQKFLFLKGNKKPIEWEIIFALSERFFKYRFSIYKDEVLEESLVEFTLSGKEKLQFKRGKKINLGAEFRGAKDIFEEKTRKDVLFLSAAAQWNNELALKIVTGLKMISLIRADRSEQYGHSTIQMFKSDAKKRKKILNFLKRADFLIEDGEVETKEFPESFKKFIVTSQRRDFFDTVNFFHPVFNERKRKVGKEKLNIVMESTGTRRFFEILGPVLDTLEKGGVLFIDEFDSSYHPLLSKFILNLFEEENPKKAQLVVVLHDVSLISEREDFNKEQIWFTEKDRYGAGKIFSLAEFDLRNDTEFSKKYLSGRFGAIPFIE